MERANGALAADPDMLRLIDGSNGCFLDEAGAAQTTLYRKLA
mgnify:FL=1